jgi:uncharacterized membrane protein
MKFSCSITINQPRENVVAYFINPEYLGEYQEGFIKKELVSGVAGQNGAISKMYYKMGKGEMQLTETILSNNLPESFSSKYHHKHTDNTMKCIFTIVDDNSTQYDSEIEYTAFRGFVINVMAKLFPSFFKKQVQKWLNNFKVFVEENG